MAEVISALVAALRSLLQPRMLSLVLWPMLLAVLLWTGAAYWFWGDWIDGLGGMLQETPLQQWMAQGVFALLAHYLAAAVLVLLLLPAIYVTALLIAALFSMPLMVEHVASRHYPGLERKEGGRTAGSIANALVAVVVYGAGWLLSLPLWLLSPFALALPLLWMAYLNQRLFRYDALAAHASREEYAQVVERAAPKLYLLGACLGLLQFVPLLNLFLPIYAGLAFVHLCLAELQRLRAAGPGPAASGRG